MAEKIKIGVIGCNVGRYWVAGAKASEQTTAWAVADLNQEYKGEMTMAEKIKIGVIGCNIGRYWVAGAKASEQTTAWAVANLNQE